MRKILAALAVLLVLLIGVVLVRAGLAKSRQLPNVAATVKEADAEQVARHLSGAIKFQTLSLDPKSGHASSQDSFDQFHSYLEATYPSAHHAMKREVINGASLLYTWKGKDPTLAAALLIGHQDVVPANDAQEPWQHPPFSGAIVGGEVWGRGTLDDKINVIGALEAVEQLTADGFQPSRTFYLAFGQDEELNGEQGAQAMARLLQSRGAKVDFLLDEGSFVTEDMLPGIQKAVSAVAIAEKGYLDLEMSVASAGGHSSAPPKHTAVGILSRAITRLEDNPLPSRMDGAIEQTFRYAGPEMGFALRAVSANEWLTSGILRKELEASPTTNGQVRTTAAVNQVFGSDTPNVLPETARAVVNFRLLPGDRIEDVVAHVKKVVDDPQVHLKVLVGNEAPPLADIESPSGRVLQETLRQVFPDTVLAPILSPGATDARNYAGLTSNLFRFIPVTVNDDALKMIHGKNERIPVKDLGKAVQFYQQLIVNLGGK